jgi:hypothetical protein
MNILDENIPDDQQKLLKKWRIRSNKIGREIGRKGMKDENQVIPLLHSLSRPVLFTCDMGFYAVRFAHKACCLVCIAARPRDAAGFIRRFLRHPAFNTKAKRMGCAVCVSDVGLRAWRCGENDELILVWNKR